MQNLPVELQEEILFSLREPRDLYQACSVSRGNRQLCSDASFWREKFRREDLPLLEEGSNPAQWISIYDRSIQAAHTADRMISSNQEIQIALSQVTDGNLVEIPGAGIKGLWEVMQKGGVERYMGWVAVMQTEITVVHDYYLILYPRGDKYMYEKIDNQEERTEYGTIRQILSVPGIKIALNKEDVWFLVYRLAYFGYPF